MPLAKIPLSEIKVDDAFNCREKVNMVEIRELCASILEHGLLQPVIVRPIKDPDFKYQLIAGYRRVKSHIILGKESDKYLEIEAKIVDVSDAEAFKINITENLQRKELNKKEEAHAVGRLREMGLVQERIAEEIGKSRGWVQIRLNLYDLPEDIQDAVVAWKFTDVQVTDLWQMPTKEEQYAAVKLVKERKQRGEKVKGRITKRERPKNKLLIPKKNEVIEMMSTVANEWGAGYCIITRAMAWCVGEVTDGDFEREVKEYVQSQMDA